MSFQIAKLYFRLKIDGSIPSSEARAKVMKKEIERMKNLGIIEDVRVGNGKVFRILSRKMFDVEEQRKWKNGVEKALETHYNKSDYAINSNSTKFRKITYPTLSLRILDGKSVTIDEISLPRGITGIPGVFSIELLESYLTKIRIIGTLVMVENKESFLHADSYFPDAAAILYYSGRTTKKWDEWLLSNVEKIIFAPDYDPVGMEEFLRQKRNLNDKIELYIPSNLEELFIHGNNILYLDQYHILIRLSDKEHSTDVELVLNLIRHYKKGVEQEVIFRLVNQDD